MITGFYCTNVFSEHAKELIDFYREVRLNDLDGNEIVIMEIVQDFNDIKN